MTEGRLEALLLLQCHREHCLCQTTCSAHLLNKCLAAAEVGDRLVTIGIGRKLGAVPVFFGGGSAGSPCSTNTQCGLGRGLYLCTRWHPYPSSRFATINMGRKVGGGAVPLFTGGAGSPSNTMWPGPRPTSAPSGILIHPTVWPQYTNVTDRQVRTDRQTDRQDR